uniref:FACT complex subunit POB3 n=1 Tax=Metchnikovella dogieli TaxID=2804710 RepID=A0A896WPE1_9MICR|nr:FACT complex component POB3 [Metchnikovella dogieli]
MVSELVLEKVCLVRDHFNVLNGKLKLVGNGVGFKESVTGEVITIEADKIMSCVWGRSLRDYQLTLEDSEGGRMVVQNIKADDRQALKDFFKKNHGKELEIREMACSGENGGEMAFGDRGIVFAAGDKTLFEVPFEEVIGVSVKEKDELAIELKAFDAQQQDGRDYLAEVRVYISDKEAGEGGEHSGEEIEESAKRICHALQKAAHLEEKTGKVLASISDFSFLVPRGRYQLDVAEGYIRLHGKTYDYKIQNAAIKSLLLVPLADETGFYFMVELEPAIRKGQTRYPFLVSQLDRRELFVSHVGGKEYAGPMYSVVSALFSDISDTAVTTEGEWRNAGGACCVRCSYKASDGWLYLLEKKIVFLPRPSIVVSRGDIGAVRVERLDKSSRISKTFDLKILLKSGHSHQFSNLTNNEFQGLTRFFSLWDCPFDVEKEAAPEVFKQGSGESGSDEEDSDGEYKEDSSGSESDLTDESTGIESEGE